MKVLYLSPGGSAQGGAERSLGLLIEGMVANGHEVYVDVLMGGDAADLFAEAGAIVLRRAVRLDRARRHGTASEFALGALRSAPAVVQLALTVRRDARDLDVDVVHSNGFRTHLLAPLLRPGGPRQVWSLRDVAPRGAPQLALAVASIGAHAVVANSQFTAQECRGFRSTVEVVQNPVRTVAVHDRAVAKATLGVPSDRQIVAVVAHLHPSKGHHIAVDAVADWEGSDRPYLLIAGGCLYGSESDRYRDQLCRKISVAELSSDVMLLGGVGDVSTVYAAADVIVQPAIHPEGFGRVVVEAQQSQVPVIATALGGANELIDDGESGLLISANDSSSLRIALERVLRDSALAANLVEGGVAAGSRFSVEVHARAMETVYERVMCQ